MPCFENASNIFVVDMIELNSFQIPARPHQIIQVIYMFLISFNASVLFRFLFGWRQIAEMCSYDVRRFYFLKLWLNQMVIVSAPIQFHFVSYNFVCLYRFFSLSRHSYSAFTLNWCRDTRKACCCNIKLYFSASTLFWRSIMFGYIRNNTTCLWPSSRYSITTT